MLSERLRNFKKCPKCKGRGWVPARRKDGWPDGCDSCHGLGLQMTLTTLAGLLEMKLRTVKLAFSRDGSEATRQKVGAAIQELFYGKPDDEAA